MGNRRVGRRGRGVFGREGGGQREKREIRGERHEREGERDKRGTVGKGKSINTTHDEGEEESELGITKRIEGLTRRKREKGGEWKRTKEKGQEWNAVKVKHGHGERARSVSSTHKYEY